MENPQFKLETEFETLVLFFHRIVEKDNTLQDDIVLSYFEKVESHHTNKDQLEETHRRENVDRMLKQLEWQIYCGDPQRIKKATDFLKINPVLTFIGIGGLGKTALATEIIRRKLVTREFDYMLLHQKILNRDNLPSQTMRNLVRKWSRGHILAIMRISLKW